jgi:hypothetical protein
VQELVLWEAQVLERLLEMRLEDPVLELQLAESWGSVLERWSAISSKVKKISISSNSNKSKRTRLKSSVNGWSSSVSNVSESTK